MNPPTLLSRVIVETYAQGGQTRTSQDAVAPSPESVKARADAKAVLEYIVSCGASGAADYETSHATALPFKEVRVIRHALTKLGQVADSGERKIRPDTGYLAALHAACS